MSSNNAQWDTLKDFQFKDLKAKQTPFLSRWVLKKFYFVVGLRKKRASEGLRKFNGALKFKQ